MEQDTGVDYTAPDQEIVPSDELDTSTGEASPRTAIDRAFDAVDIIEGEIAADAEVEQSGAEADSASVQRDIGEPPRRFSSDAKGVWMEAPLPVRAEIHRMERELEAGLEKYKDDARAFEDYREFADYLGETGQNFHDVLAHYTGIEAMLREDPIRGLDQICNNLGTDLRSVAAHILGQASEEGALQQDPHVGQLQQRILQLEEQLGGVTTDLAHQRSQEAMDVIDAFREDHPRFDELAHDIALLLNTGRANELDTAYDLANRLNPAADPDLSHSTPQAVQTRKSKLSVDGGPGNGSNPVLRKPPTSARDAVENAFATLGIG